MFHPERLPEAMPTPHAPKPPAHAGPLSPSGRPSNEALSQQKAKEPVQDGWLLTSKLWWIAAPKQEQAFFGGCLLILWLISAASLSGYTIAVLFLIVAIGRLVRHAAVLFLSKLPRRSQLRHYLLVCTSVAFFSLLAVRGCYLATVIVDTEFRSDPFEVRSGINQD